MRREIPCLTRADGSGQRMKILHPETRSARPHRKPKIAVRDSPPRSDSLGSPMRQCSISPARAPRPRPNAGKRELALPFFTTHGPSQHHPSRRVEGRAPACPLSTVRRRSQCPITRPARHGPSPDAGKRELALPFFTPRGPSTSPVSPRGGARSCVPDFDGPGMFPLSHHLSNTPRSRPNAGKR
jgi:hypothetical protein